jgi:hypothetical protein
LRQLLKAIVKHESTGRLGRWIFLVVKPAVNTLAKPFD